MDIQAFQYILGQGWSLNEFPDLDSEQTLVLVFASPEFINHVKPIIELANFYSKSSLIGCSSAGEIFGSKIFDQSLSVVVVRFNTTLLKIAKAKVEHVTDSNRAGISIAQQLKGPDLKSIFVLSDGLSVNGSELVKGLNTVAEDKGLVITGGLAGDGSNFKQTWTVVGGEILTNYVVAVGFYGSHIHVGHASKGGWDKFGPVRRVTRSESNILYELDYQPALQLYKEYLGEKASELPSSGLLYPLAISEIDGNESIQLVRTILAVDEKEQSLIFAGDIPTGCYAQLMRANFDRLIDSANEAGQLANQRMMNDHLDTIGPLLAIDISCVGRRLLLGERTEEEIESALISLPKGSTQVGFYSYGELSPFAVGKCELHNQTMTITTFYEY
ncbi:FIST signal transduction protein [Legionella bononiensis]|uniref:FIST C-terminal domain-containing protein n=1 Tax=Legionella bononiensis TaxID=2793102 RepID=A0ABS1WCX9_9GAMM|nr:FIST N-terminal domain-containing protein [Legionella bononiensis]MBL7479074.1 FIST C-terminal domain-containing protein [Legionella bononiensis]MBL7527207.1 FIST C-terminal domain-containing protein [Legionella bononiensis]MBL7562176.1 FIST C-terminal domain-containing protein [Legionella bononiensis]